MLRIPVISKPNKMLVAWALAFDLFLALILLFSPGQGYCSGIEGQVLRKDAATSNVAEQTAGPGPERYVIVVRHADSNRVVMRITPDEDGYFRLMIVPGRYRLEVESLDQSVQLSGSASASVVEGKISNVSIQMFRRMTEQARPPQGFALSAGDLPLVFA